MKPYETPVRKSNSPPSLNNKQGTINFLFGLACIAVIVFYAPVLIPLALSMWAWIIQASNASLVTSLLISASLIGIFMCVGHNVQHAITPVDKRGSRQLSAATDGSATFSNNEVTISTLHPNSDLSIEVRKPIKLEEHFDQVC